jgi:hypothetical protein
MTNNTMTDNTMPNNTTTNNTMTDNTVTNNTMTNKAMTKKKIKEHGKSVQYFEGVEQCFARINQYAKEKCINLEHYIISSGSKEMIEGTSIAKEFKCIFASSFKYDHEGVPEWPALAINHIFKQNRAVCWWRVFINARIVPSVVNAFVDTK